MVKDGKMTTTSPEKPQAVDFQTALDMAVKEIQSMPKAELEKQLEQAKQTPFAQTVDILTQIHD